MGSTDKSDQMCNSYKLDEKDLKSCIRKNFYVF